MQFIVRHPLETTMLRLYDSRLSGNSWKVRILLSQLGLPYERVTLDIRKGETRDPAFRQISRFARVPVLLLEDGRPIVESGAILVHLADGTRYLPDDPHLRTEVMSWLFFEQADLQKKHCYGTRAPLARPRQRPDAGHRALSRRWIPCTREVGRMASRSHLARWRQLHHRRPRDIGICVAGRTRRLRDGALLGHPRMGGTRARSARMGTSASRGEHSNS